MESDSAPAIAWWKPEPEPVSIVTTYDGVSVWLDAKEVSGLRTNLKLLEQHYPRLFSGITHALMDNPLTSFPMAFGDICDADINVLEATGVVRRGKAHLKADDRDLGTLPIIDSQIAAMARAALTLRDESI